MKKEIKYQIAISLFQSEGQIQWSRFSAMLIVNTIIIGLVGFNYRGEFSIPILFRKGLPILGILLCFLWYKMTKRGFMWIRFWIQKAREIESSERLNEIKPITDGDSFRKQVSEIFITKTCSSLVIFVFTLIYILAFLMENTIGVNYDICINSC